MEWKGRRQSGNIEDQRGAGPSAGGSNPFGRGNGGFRIPMGGGRRAGGGMSIGTIIFLVVIYFVFKAMGIDLLQVMGQGGGQVSMPGFEQTESASRRASPQEEETKAFMATVLAETEDTWNGIFQAAGERYEEPKMVLFSGSVQSACGFASAASGPFYCPGDRKVYIDLAFYDTLQRQLGAPGDFAQAYVIAHEVGHHVQNLLGVTAKMDEMRGRVSQQRYNAMSVRVELQADCFAGIWGHHADQARQLLEQGDVEEALNAAARIGDDALQRQQGGPVVPERFTHGSSAQRVAWFKRGLQSGDLRACDTFQARQL